VHVEDTVVTVLSDGSGPPQILQALVDIANELAKVGIAKGRRNEQQGFAFRGIDDVFNVASPLFPKYGVVFLPTYADRIEVERVTGKAQTLMLHTTVTGEFTFVSAKDGSSVRVVTFGSAMDSGDKGCNKSMSAALKYALLQTFLIPTESNEDADATTPEPSVPKPPDGFDEWFAGIREESVHGFDAVRQAWRDSPEHYRTYAMQFRGPEWVETKARANEATAAAKKAAGAVAAEKPAKATK
jgi:hypothetical protein